MISSFQPLIVELCSNAGNKHADSLARQVTRSIVQVAMIIVTVFLFAAPSSAGELDCDSASALSRCQLSQLSDMSPGSVGKRSNENFSRASTRDEFKPAATEYYVADHRTDTGTLLQPQSSLVQSQLLVDGLNLRLAAEYVVINVHKLSIASRYLSFKRAPWHEKGSRYAAYLAEKSWRTADMARRYINIGSLESKLLLANSDLDREKEAL